MGTPSTHPTPLANGSMAGACLRRRCKPKVNSSLSQHERCWGIPVGTPQTTQPAAVAAAATAVAVVAGAAGSGVAKFAPFHAMPPVLPSSHGALGVLLVGRFLRSTSYNSPHVIYYHMQSCSHV